MGTSTDERLDKLIETLSAQTSFLRSLGLDDSARLLDMVSLELKMHVYAITDEELRELCARPAVTECEEARDTAERNPTTREAAEGQSAMRASAGRVVVPMETHVRRARGPRKHAR